MAKDKSLDLEIASLKAEISKYNIAYHQKDEPLISDAEFDKLIIRLNQLEEKTNIQILKVKKMNHINK